MRVARRAKVAALLAVGTLAIPAGLVVGTAGTASASAYCGQTVADHDASNWPYMPAGVSANERSGSSTGCDVKGWADNQDQLDYHCYTWGENGSWTYLRNNSDGSTGWVKDSLLPLVGGIHGSGVWCQF